MEPDVAIAVDVTATGDTPKGEQLNMKLGGHGHQGERQQPHHPCRRAPPAY